MSDDPKPKPESEEKTPRLFLVSLRYISLTPEPYAEVSVGCSIDVAEGVYHNVEVAVKLLRAEEELFSMTLRQIETLAVAEAKRVLRLIE
jgi:hypothetical protein